MNQVIIYKCEKVFANRRQIAIYEREAYAREMASELMAAAGSMLICGSEISKIRGVVNQALDNLEQGDIE